MGSFGSFVVSLSCGTANAVENMLHNEGFIRSFDSLSLMFDNDSSTEVEKKNIIRGKEATEVCSKCSSWYWYYTMYH